MSRRVFTQIKFKKKKKIVSRQVSADCAAARPMQIVKNHCVYYVLRRSKTTEIRFRRSRRRTHNNNIASVGVRRHLRNVLRYYYTSHWRLDANSIQTILIGHYLRQVQAGRVIREMRQTNSYFDRRQTRYSIELVRIRQRTAWIVCAIFQFNGPGTSVADLFSL